MGKNKALVSVSGMEMRISILVHNFTLNKPVFSQNVKIQSYPKV